MDTSTFLPLWILGVPFLVIAIELVRTLSMKTSGRAFTGPATFRGVNEARTIP